MVPCFWWKPHSLSKTSWHDVTYALAPLNQSHEAFDAYLAQLFGRLSGLHVTPQQAAACVIRGKGKRWKLVPAGLAAIGLCPEDLAGLVTPLTEEQLVAIQAGVKTRMAAATTAAATAPEPTDVGQGAEAATRVAMEQAATATALAPAAAVAQPAPGPAASSTEAPVQAGPTHPSSGAAPCLPAVAQTLVLHQLPLSSLPMAVYHSEPGASVCHSSVLLLDAPRVPATAITRVTSPLPSQLEW